MDYWFGSEKNRRTVENPMLVVVDERSGSISGYAVGHKGVVEWVVKKVVQDIESWGWGGQRIVLRSDGEESIMVLKKSIGEMNHGGWVPEESLVGESKSAGITEREQ